MAQKTLTIWCVTDDKPGHKSQLEGLLQALAEQLPLEVSWIRCSDAMVKRLRGHTAVPDLILAAGHRTHLTALLLKWRYGGKIVLLMKPSLPVWLFDLCVIPEHDGVQPSARVICTQGAMNAIRPSTALDPERGLILIGGPSKHHGWSDRQVLEQLRQIQRRQPDICWTLTTSRRTPASFFEKVQSLCGEQFTVVPVEQTDRQWLLDQYRSNAQIWVTEDSVSMVYESLSSGAAVGVLAVPRLRQSRISTGLDRLLAAGRLLSLQHEPTGQQAVEPLQEAGRVAKIILEQFEIPCEQ